MLVWEVLAEALLEELTCSPSCARSQTHSTPLALTESWYILEKKTFSFFMCDWNNQTWCLYWINKAPPSFTRYSQGTLLREQVIGYILAFTNSPRTRPLHKAQITQLACLSQQWFTLQQHPHSYTQVLGKKEQGSQQRQEELALPHLHANTPLPVDALDYAQRTKVSFTYLPEKQGQGTRHHWGNSSVNWRR
jgi:hypothetical protein